MARQQRKYHYIYKITCKVTNRYYIGMHSTDNLNDGYFGSGKRLWFSINYHGKENHEKEILEFLSTREELKKREKEIVTSELIREELCMNLIVGGEGGYISEDGVKKGREKSDEILKRKHGEGFKKVIIKNFHLGLTETLKKEWTDKIKSGQSNFDHKTFTGKKHTTLTKELMRKSKNLGETNSQYGTCWITKDGLNKKINKADLDKEIMHGWIKGRK